MSTSQNNSKKSEKQNGNNAARYEQQILDTSSIGVLITRIGDGTILYANKAIANLLGIADVTSVVGMPVPNFYWDLEDRKAMLERFQAEGSVNNNEIRARRIDGSMLWVSISIQPFQFEDEQVLLSEITDITRRKQAEQAQHASEDKFRSIYDNATIGLYRTTPGGQILMINPTGLRLLGFDSFEEMSQRNLEQSGFEEVDARKKFRERLEREGVIEQESVWTKKDGSPIFVRESSTISRDENNNILYYDGSFEDITAHKQAEDALRLSEERFRRFTEVTVEGLVFHEQGKIVDANPAALAMFGLSDNTEFFGRNLLEFIVPESQKQVLQQMQLEAVLPYEIQCVGKDGSIFPVETSTRTFKEGDRIIRASSIRDITERKQFESQIQEAFERRGYQVQISTEISQEVAAASEINDLFDRVVTLTKERLGYYHTQLLRYDAAQDAVVLINGYGEIGQKMLAGGHQMPMGEGLIGTAAASGETVLRPTLADDPDWQPNPLLPETKGEIAVPIKWQNKVLGVLDVQSNQAGALSDEDRLLFEGLCGQIAIAMHSAELVETVRQNETRLSEALRIARLGNWEYDFENDLFIFTDDFYSIFRTTAERVGGYKISSADYSKNFVHPDDAPLVGSEIQKVLDAKDRLFTTNLEHRMIFSDGKIGYIAVNINVERDENGKITRWYGANQDITERKLAEEALRINEARLAEALLAARLANWEYDVEKDLFTFNDHFYSIFHTTAEKAGGYQLSSARYAELFVHPDDMEVVGTEIGKALSSTERVYNTILDHRIRYEDGGVGYIMVQLTVERDENGKITRYYGANQDITERKLAEETLRVNEARLAEALKIARLANWEYDVEKDLFTFNDQFYSIFHTTVEKVGGYQITSARYMELFVYPEDAHLVGGEIGRALSSTERVYNTSLEHRVLYSDGGMGTITVAVTVERDENGKITRFYGANQDITERKKAEEEMAERLEEINRLYQNLSHEGWKTYRDTADLPTGFVFDQTGTKVMDDEILADNLFANVPMKVLGGEVVGMLTVANDPRNPTSADDLAFFQQVSDQIALALEGARLTAQTQSALSQTEKLSDASLRFARAVDLQELIKIAVETLNIPKINRAVLETFNYTTANEVESLDIVATWWNNTGKEPTAVGTHYTAASLPIIQLFITPTPLFINDTLNDKRIDNSTLSIVKQLSIRSIAILPLYLGVQQIGVLLLEAEEAHDFKEEETRLFSAMGPQIATVLENRRQFERAQQQAERESTLNLISQKIQSATTVEAVLQIAARELGHALGAPMTIAQLSMKDKK